MFVVFVVASALSMRRKPLVGLIGAFVLVAPTLGRAMSRKRLTSVGLLVAGLAIPITILLGPLVAEGARAYVGVEALTVQARTALYGGSLLLARDHFPLGSGVGTYGSYGSVTSYSPIYYQFGFNLIYGMSPAYPNFIQDTFWPQILGETGVVGLLGYGGALLSILIGAWKSARSVDDPRARAIAIGATLVGVETLLESSASPTYSIAMCGCISVGLLAVAAALGRSATSQLAGPHPALEG
jgi:O-antigen ligase